MSVEQRVLKPIYIVAGVGLVSAATVGGVAFKLFDGVERNIDQSLHAMITSESIQKSITEADTVVADVMSMTRLMDLDQAVGDFNARVDGAEAAIDALKREASSNAMRERVEELESFLSIWVSDAEIVLGVQPSSEIPTQELLHRRRMDVTNATEDLKAFSQATAVKTLQESGDRLFWAEAILLLLMSGAIGGAIFLAMKSAKSLSRSVIEVADSLRELSGATTARKAGSEPDEIVEMQTALKALSAQLSERDALAQREKEAQAHDKQARVQKEARAAAMAEFQVELRNVVAAAGRGDLNVRILSHYADADLNEMGEGMNELMGNIGRVVESVSKVMKDLASGRLDSRMEGRFEGVFGDLRNNVDTTTSRLRELISAIGASTEEIRQSSSLITSGSQDLSLRTDSQAASLEETASATEQLSQTVRQNALLAQKASGLSEEAKGAAINGGDIALKAVDSIRRMESSTKQIAEVTSLVDGIAFQTNLLALNAAVEAARAGEAGLGFAVVASEVRSLAQRASEASREISDLIGRSNAQIADSVLQVEAMREILQEIGKETTAASSAVSDITAATSEQAVGLSQVAAAINRLDEVTQKNAVMASDSATAAGSLASEAERLARLIAFFSEDEIETVARRVA